MSQASGDQTPLNSAGPTPGGEISPPAGGSWPPLPPPLVNRLVSSATAVPFVPEEKRPVVVDTSFSCVVEPPAKRRRSNGAADGAETSVRSVVPTAAPTAGAGAPAVTPNPALIGARPPTSNAVATAPMATMPPFAHGGTTAPFTPPGSAAPYEFNPAKPPQVRWLSWSTLLLLAGCVAGYFQYQRMQQAQAAAPTASVSTVAAPVPPTAGTSTVSSLATPFTALKQAKATIKDAGEKHKASYELVEKMLDDPNAAMDVAPKPVVAAAVATPVEPEPSGRPKRDAVTALLGSDGEFFVPAGSPKPSLAFARWLRSVKIGGARLSDRPRVLVGAGAFMFGDVVELNLGIVLEGYNAERRALRFKETSTGALIERRL